LFRTYHVGLYYLTKLHEKLNQVVFWNGYTAGGGTGFSINAPIRIATEKTSFSMPEVKIGYVVDAGSSYYFSKVCKKELGMYLGATGR